jgi:hypothetical protein
MFKDFDDTYEKIILNILAMISVNYADWGNVFMFTYGIIDLLGPGR